MTRKDYLNDPSAPKANSIVVASSAIVRDGQNRILMIRRTDNGYHSIPGGRLEPGETVSECAMRETLEETGVLISITGLVGIYSNPSHVIEYDDGEVRQEFSICFRAVAVGGKETPSNESSEVIWAVQEELAELDIHPSTKLRIRHALAVTNEAFYS